MFQIERSKEALKAVAFWNFPIESVHLAVMKVVQTKRRRQISRKNLGSF